MRALIFAAAAVALLALASASHGLLSDDEIKYEAKEVANKNPRELLRLRGFKSENHYFKTVDGYLVNLVRIVNPHVARHELKRPVLFNHGLYESATIWLINSRNVHAKPYSQRCSPSGKYIVEKPAFKSNGDSLFADQFRNIPMMLANYAYDVWLMSMRGTQYSRRHVSLNDTQAEFWDYSLDDFALKDVPGAIDYIRMKTKARKVGYVGHSQATFSVFALLATKTRYAKVIEPVAAVAPVSYFDHITSLLRQQFLAALKAPDQTANGPSPPDAKKVREGLGELCSANNRHAEVAPICDTVEELVVGPSGKGSLSGYYSHIPFASSKKVLRHFGHLIRDRRFKHYDYGPTQNFKLYGSSRAPDYKIERIKSEAICLFYSSRDTVSAPHDVFRFRDALRVPLLRDVFIDQDKINHLDLILKEQASAVIARELLEVLEEFTLQQREHKCHKNDHNKWSSVKNAPKHNKSKLNLHKQHFVEG